jgi:small-conductance mechanosensitive channel
MMKAGDEKISNLMDYAERLERERDQIAELAKRQQVDLQIAAYDKDLAETRLNTLQHAFKELMSSYETLKSRQIEEATINAEEVREICQKANDEISQIQKQRNDEKEQYLVVQKGFQNQVESNKIKFDNLVKRVIEVRKAQQVFFDKKKKVGSAPTELELSKRLEADLDKYLKPFQNNLFYTK